MLSHTVGDVSLILSEFHFVPNPISLLGFIPGEQFLAENNAKRPHKYPPPDRMGWVVLGPAELQERSAFDDANLFSFVFIRLLCNPG